MGRLCGGAHEISGLKAPLFLHGGWLEVLGIGGWVGGGGVGHGWMGGWVCGDGVDGWGGGVVGPYDTPHHGGMSDAPPFF